MRLLILGWSSLVQRRVRPALQGLGVVEQIELASRHMTEENQVQSWDLGRVYPDYRDALEASAAELVYVSLINGEHARWAEAALNCGRHVVVDKPAFLGLEQAEQMLDLAAKRGVCLAEATVFGYHPQVAMINEQFAAAEVEPSRITATFSFPPMDPKNFRYQRAMGGGALWDLGPYAAAIGRVFWDEEPVEIACQILPGGGSSEVETAFATLCTFSGGRSVVGTFGFDTVYRNRLDLIGDQLGVEVDRIFTTPPDVANEVRLTRRNGATSVMAPAGDAFAAFFDHVMARIAARDWTQLTGDLHRDARTLQRLRSAAGIE